MSELANCDDLEDSVPCAVKCTPAQIAEQI